MNGAKLIQRCPTCGGTKRLRGMGMIEKDCYECKGVGYIESETIEKDAVSAKGKVKIDEAALQPKKRGRKKKGE